MTITDRVTTFLLKVRFNRITNDEAREFEKIVREIAREEIKAADDADKERRRQMLQDMRDGKPIDAFVNRGDNPHGQVPDESGDIDQ